MSFLLVNCIFIRDRHEGGGVFFSLLVAAGVVTVVSHGNALGRVFWAWVSDLVTRKDTFFVMFLLQVLLSGTYRGALHFIAESHAALRRAPHLGFSTAKRCDAANKGYTSWLPRNLPASRCSTGILASAVFSIVALPRACIQQPRTPSSVLCYKKLSSMPQKTRNIELTQVTQWEDGKTTRVEDYLSTEEPLEMRAGRYSLGVTLRTPGDDKELVAGFLFTEGIISRQEDFVSMRMPGDTSPQRNLVRVILNPKVRLAPGSAARRFSAGSACGVCGKASIAQLRRRGLRHPEATTVFDPEILCQLPEKLRGAQAAFGRTGGLHAAALFDAHGELKVLREDIGRHNAVDKVIGWAFLEGRLPLGEHILLVSGRGGFEIVQKAISAGVPLLASVSAPSSLAVQLARELGLTLVGFLRGRRFVIYSNEDRLAASATK